jgi:hypothetical protein
MEGKVTRTALKKNNKIGKIHLFNFKTVWWPGMVIHTYNPSTQEAKTGG